MEKRNAFIKMLEVNLTKYNANLIEMKAKVTEVQDDMKAEYLSQVEKLENKQDDL